MGDNYDLKSFYDPFARYVGQKASLLWVYGTAVGQKES